MEHLNTRLNIDSSSSNSPSALSTTGKLLIGVTGGVAIGLSIVCASFVSPALRRVCLPYIPATDQQVNNVFNALKATNRTSKRAFVDLGSGDGRIVFEAAKRQWQQSHGVELNLWLVLYSKIQSYLNGTNSATKFFKRDLWKFDLSTYDNIVIFGVEQMMHELEVKFVEECKSECNIVVCRFALPNLRPEITIGHGVDTVWLYKLPKTTSLNTKLCI